jgi:Fe-S cluster assembly scaffold protein SufB
MLDRGKLKARARAALTKRAALGADLDLARYERTSPPRPALSTSELACLPQADRHRMLLAGVDLENRERGGTFLFMDTSVLHCSSQQEGLEVLPLEKALESLDWFGGYYWKLVEVDTDKYTASAELDLHGGYVIRSLPGSRCIHPLQACIYLDHEGLQQNVHNIIIAEEGSELHIISGCASSARLRTGLHVGVTEFFVRRNARLTFTMIHNWAEDMAVRLRSATLVEEGGLFVSNYVCMKPVRSLQGYPTARLAGPGAVARFYSVLAGSPVSDIDLGARVILEQPGCRSEIVSRAITNGGRIMARGHLIGRVPGIKAHLECRGLILGGGAMLAVPELEGYADGVEMSHEAAVGKIAQEEINYLMARGLDEEQAVSTIVRGFLKVEVPGLHPLLQAELDRAVTATQAQAM